jgi:hypothetical protein
MCCPLIFQDGDDIMLLQEFEFPYGHKIQKAKHKPANK